MRSAIQGRDSCVEALGGSPHHDAVCGLLVTRGPATAIEGYALGLRDRTWHNVIYEQGRREARMHAYIRESKPAYRGLECDRKSTRALRTARERE